jgi:hypothetical protein
MVEGAKLTAEGERSSAITSLFTFSSFEKMKRKNKRKSARYKKTMK